MVFVAFPECPETKIAAVGDLSHFETNKYLSKFESICQYLTKVTTRITITMYHSSNEIISKSVY